ncbi:hypothetical protein MYX82_00565, partial [Acidobacteria bacterium AH-259-D05]|nr:hypothetical protein [Acidobacteria bacterium AH-259-D05]
MNLGSRFHQILIFGVLLILLGSPLAAQKFLPDDPIWKDDDRLPIEMPRPRDLSQIVDFLNSTFRHRPKEEEKIVRAENVNTLGEVPDSSWFTNRIGRRLMSLEELVRGPNQLQGPDLSRLWVVVRAKSEGITPGFTIRDGRGETYFVKFDPPHYPQMATSTEMICTKFFHAFGYNVPENYLVLVRREYVRVAPGATITDENGKKRRMTEKDVDRIFDRVAKRPDGSAQVLASRALPGKPLGPFKYFGTRRDDANDIFPHENRRELRGLRVFAAWTNHDDARSINSLDTYFKEADGGYIKHHLIDFGSCFGSGSVKPQSRRAGNEYILEWLPALKAGLSLGLADRPWRQVKYPDYPSIGRFEANFFDPAQWKPEYPSPAFDRMLPDDAFWATRIVMRFSDEMIRALLRTGQIIDPEAENYLGDTLIKRRDKIIAYFLTLVNPLDEFQIAGNPGSSRLEFKNLGVEAGLSRVDSYQYQWFRFDNSHLTLEPLGEVQSTPEPVLVIPGDRADFLMVRILTISPEHEAWQKKVEVFIRNGVEKSVIG